MNLSDILNKVWENIPLTGEESEFLSRHITSDNGKREFEDGLVGLWNDFESNAIFDDEAVLARIRQQIGVEQSIKPRPRVLSLSRFLPYVAAAIVLVVGAIYWVLQPGQQKEEKTIMAVKNQVELITPEGKKIVLDDEEQLPAGFEVVVGKEVGSQLVYNDSASHAKAVVQYMTLHVPRGESYSMRLPDGTQVYLNAMTTLRFPEKFNADSREVYLNGEAAFAVKANEQLPFYVHTGHRTVKVTGTKFNVTAYDDDVLWRTSLFEGKVSIVGGKKSVEMIPNQQYVFNKDLDYNWLKNFSGGEEVFAGWMSGTLDFRASTLSDIVRQLQRWYDFTVNYEEEALKNRRFTATVSKEEPLNDFFNMIERTTDIEITLQGNHMRIGRKLSK